MSLKDRMDEIKKKMQEQIQRGRVKSEQQRAKKLRRKDNKLANMKPGAKRAMVEGLAMKSSPLDVARNEYIRRKYERKKKYADKGKDDSGQD